MRTAILLLAACGSSPHAPSPSPSSGSAVAPPPAAHDKTTPPNLFDAPETLSARSLAKGAEAAAYAFTPDGAWVVYASKTDGMVALRPDGSNKRVLFKPKVGWIAPAQFQVSANGKHVVFATADSEQVPSGHVYAAAIDGSARPVQLTTDANHYNLMRITPEGAWVAFTTMQGEAALAPIAGGKPRPLVAAHPLATQFELLPDNRVVYRGEKHVQIRDLLGGKPRDLAPNVTEAVLGAIIDGAVVVYVDQDIYIAPLDGSKAIKIAPPFRVPPHAIAGGRGFVFATNTDEMYVDAKTHAVRRLTRPVVEPEAVFFNDATRDTAFYAVANTLSFPGRRYELRVTALDGSFPDRAYAMVHANNVDVRPSGDRRVVVHVRTDERKMAVFSIALDTGRMARLTPLWPESYGELVVSGKHALLDANGELFIIDLP